MQEYMVRIGVALKRRDQIQYRKPDAPAEILDPVIRVKQVGLGVSWTHAAPQEWSVELDRKTAQWTGYALYCKGGSSSGGARMGEP